MLRRIKKQASRFFGLAPGSERDDALAALEELKRSLGARLAGYNQTLAASAQFCSVLKEQIRAAETRERAISGVLESASRAKLRDDQVGDLLVELESLRENLPTLRNQFADAEATCHQITAARDAAILEARQKLDAMQGALTDLQMRQAIRDIFQQLRTPT